MAQRIRRTAGLAATLRSASPRAASPTRPPFSEMLGGHLYEELPPPPPESEVPDEYHLYDLNHLYHQFNMNKKYEYELFLPI